MAADPSSPSLPEATQHTRTRPTPTVRPPPPPPPLQRLPIPPSQNPSCFAPPFPAMDDDAIATLMDIDDSPRSAIGAGFLEEEDDAAEMLLLAHRAGARGGDSRGGPLSFDGFFNAFDGADFDDADLA